MFYPPLASAMASGTEVLLELKNSCNCLRGRIFHLDETTVQLFHSGMGGGVLWTLPMAEIAMCGLVVDVPKDPCPFQQQDQQSSPHLQSSLSPPDLQNPAPQEDTSP